MKVTRESLDCGPQTETCADGVPSSDLTVSTLRDLKIPYAAQWEGIELAVYGVCNFNSNSQRRSRLPSITATAFVWLNDPTVKFAYACLDGDHCVEVLSRKWTCDQEFTFDVYRLR